MAPVIGNVDKAQPIRYREKSMTSFEVDNVDESYQAFLAKGVKPINMPKWGMRVVHLYDPEENLIELFTPLAAAE